MNSIEAVEWLCSLSVDDKAKIISRLSHELTIVARDTYDGNGEGVKDGVRLRQINEIQHLLTSIYRDLLESRSIGIPEPEIVQIFLGKRVDKRLESLLRFAFQQASVGQAPA